MDFTTISEPLAALGTDITAVNYPDYGLSAAEYVLLLALKELSAAGIGGGGGGGGGGGSGINWREGWDENSVAYAVGDAVIYDDPDDDYGANAYYCIGAHTSDSILPPPGNANWAVMVQGGQNGAAGASSDSSYHGFFEAPINKTYVLVLHADTAGTIASLVHKTVSGTLQATVQINGVTVTGLNAVSVSSSKTTTNASGANTFAVGDTITLIVSSASSPVDFQFSLLI